jgi:hypothetical protein
MFVKKKKLRCRSLKLRWMIHKKTRELQKQERREEFSHKLFNVTFWILRRIWIISNFFSHIESYTNHLACIILSPKAIYIIIKCRNHLACIREGIQSRIPFLTPWICGSITVFPALVHFYLLELCPPSTLLMWHFHYHTFPFT